MSEPKRLHPITAVLNGLKTLKELIIPFFAFVVFGSKGIGTILIPIIGGAVILILILASGIVSWLRYTYRLEEGELRIEYGLFVRKKRYIPFERIQSLDFSEGIFHRPFGLVKVKIETAGSSGADAEAVLTAISKVEAAAIQDVLQNAKNNRSEDVLSQEVKEEILYKISAKELLLLASTSGGVGVVISAVVAFLSQFDDIIPYETVFHQLEDLVANGVIFISILVFIGFVLAWIIAVIGMMLKYADFTLKKVDNDLIITRGLLEKKQLTIPLNRIQGIRISENLLRQPLGYASVYIESAGGSAQNAESAAVNILPFIKRDKVRGIIEGNIDGYTLSDEMISAPKRSLRRYVFRGWFLVVPISVLLIIFLRPWGFLSLLLLPLSAGWSYLKFKAAGWNQTGNQLTLSYRNVVKHTVYMQKNKIQSLAMKKSFFQSKKELASVEAKVMSGMGGAGGAVVDLEEKDVRTMYEWYSREEKAL
ncbi:PH domain-containing protein [Robertmurraya andreesenii]|uniref:Membrane protein n=1 Tax=Anoxybacillus andreesenii TaxID=1325932 RepID=A0ABT9V3Y7_9BACL|nr:PH domain-containing protein [Robertmurraya andreesenii]MDQ0155658.1 putative membrane protein [Robertmurraya andreesenii]